jgi:hypothetical protein
MKWIKYFESFNNDEVLDNIIDILSEISDTGRYRVEEYNNNPPDVPVVKNNLNRIKFYIDKNYIRTGNEINKEDIRFISPVLYRLQRYLQTYNIEVNFQMQISKENSNSFVVDFKIKGETFWISEKNNKFIPEEILMPFIDSEGRHNGYELDLEEFENLNYYYTWISIEFKK